MTRRDAYEVTGDAFVSERTRERKRERERTHLKSTISRDWLVCTYDPGLSI